MCTPTTLRFSLLRRMSSLARSSNFLINKFYVGEPKVTDFALVDEELPPLEDGQVRTKGLFWSVDPYMRVYVKAYQIPLNSVMIGGQIAEVVESRHSMYKTGDVVYGDLGWRTVTNVNVKKMARSPASFYKLPDLKGLPLSLGLGTLGMTGNTAYFGFLEVCQPREGDTVVVTGAAGAVGSHVGQIAKAKGCRVVGIAGSDDKVQWLQNDLKFDAAINYKSANVGKALRAAAPKGIDCYFDNVGGELSSTVLSQMNVGGRIAVCGSVSSYNSEKQLPLAPIVQPAMVFNQLRMEGFVVTKWADRWVEGIAQNADWVQQGKLKYRETITRGFENTPQAFIDMLKGRNFGKAVVEA